MNSKSTIWLVVVALGLFAYIYFVELRPGDSAKRLPGTAKLLPTFNPSKVTNIEINRSNEVIRAELVNDHWRLDAPPYPAQSTGIEAFLHALSALTRQNEITAQEIISKEGGLSPFGLDPPLASLKITQEATNVIQLRIGAKTLLGGRVYVQPVGASGIFMTDDSFLRYLPASAHQWRNPLLVPLNSLTFDRILITAGPRFFQLERESTNRMWRLTDPSPMRADFDRVQDLIQQVCAGRVNQFVSDDPKEDVERFGLQTPEIQVTLAQGTNPVCQVQFGKSPTNDPTQVYARCLSHSNVVLVSRSLADLVGKPYTEFRDRMLLSSRARSLDRIEVHSEEHFVLERQASNDWRIVEPFQAPTDPQLMQDFQDRLSNLEVIRVEKDAVADFAPYGLDKPQRRYILSQRAPTASGTLTNQTLEVDFGGSPTNGAAPELDKVYCRRSDEKSVYVVSRGDALSGGRAAFELRDRRIWNFASSNVMAISIRQITHQGPAERHLRRDPATHAWIKDEVKNAAIEEALHRLGELRADFWTARGEESAKQYATSPSHFELALDLSEAGKPRALKLAFGKPPYAAVVLEQGQPVIFRFPLQLFDMVRALFKHFGH